MKEVHLHCHLGGMMKNISAKVTIQQLFVLLKPEVNLGSLWAPSEVCRGCMQPRRKTGKLHAE